MKMYLYVAIELLIFFILCIRRAEGTDGSKKQKHLHHTFDLNEIPTEEEESGYNDADTSASSHQTQERPDNITRLYYDSMILHYHQSGSLKWEELRDPYIYTNETKWEKVCLRAWNATPKANYLHCTHSVFTTLTSSRLAIQCRSASRKSTRIPTEILGCYCEHRIYETIAVDKPDPKDTFFVAKVAHNRYYKFEKWAFTLHVLGEINREIEKDD